MVTLGNFWKTKGYDRGVVLLERLSGKKKNMQHTENTKNLYWANIII